MKQCSETYDKLRIELSNETCQYVSNKRESDDAKKSMEYLREATQYVSNTHFLRCNTYFLNQKRGDTMHSSKSGDQTTQCICIARSKRETSEFISPSEPEDRCEGILIKRSIKIQSDTHKNTERYEYIPT